MDFNSLTRTDIDRLTKLITERDAVKARLADISNILGGGTSAGSAFVASAPKTRGKAKRAAKTAKPRKTRGTVKEAVVELLKSAPPSGISVENIATALKRKPASLHVWFYTTGKTIKEIKKIGRGIYAWVA